MLTVESLREYGADVDTGIRRCAGKEELYLRLVKKIPDSESFAELDEAIAANNLDAAFDAVHALKGICANLALDPLLDPISEITELLRSRTQMDYSPNVDKINSALDALKALF